MLNFHTGSYILDILDKENISKKELAKRFEISEKTLNCLLNNIIPMDDWFCLAISSSLRIIQDELLKWQGAYDKQKEEEKENVL